MRPAFSSANQTAAFAILLLFLLAAPWLGGRTLLPPREQAYASEGWRWGPYPWIQKQIFEETNDIDIAFMGSSRMDWAINTPSIQQKLDEQEGRKTVVRTIGWAGAGFDTLYFVAKDLLERRHVKMLVFYDEGSGTIPNEEALHWFRFGDNRGSLAGMPVRDQGVFYFAAVVGMPENILEWLTPNLPEAADNPIPNFCETAMHAANPESRLGSVAARLGFAGHLGDNTNFESYVPQTGATPGDVLTYSEATQADFKFSNPPLPAWQTSFARQFGALARAKHVQLVLLHLPVMAEKDAATMSESRYWPDFLQTDVMMMGIPGDRFFARLAPTEIERLYCDPNHLNQNGQTYFTGLLAPALLRAYEKHRGP